MGIDELMTFVGLMLLTSVVYVYFVLKSARVRFVRRATISVVLIAGGLVLLRVPIARVFELIHLEHGSASKPVSGRELRANP